MKEYLWMRGPYDTYDAYFDGFNKIYIEPCWIILYRFTNIIA